MHGVFEYPTTDESRNTYASDQNTQQNEARGPCRQKCKKFSLILEKLMIDGDEDGRHVVYCQICRRGLATRRTQCCQNPVCSHCRKTTGGTSCPICCCPICFGASEDSQVTDCCGKVCCSSCFNRATRTTTICPLCKKQACASPGRKTLCRPCQVCSNSVAREDYRGHLLAEHPTSCAHIWDYHYCATCGFYVNPALWMEHNRQHGDGGVRSARSIAMQRILSEHRARRQKEKPPAVTETTCEEEMEESLPVLATPLQIVCPVCHFLIPDDEMPEHIMQSDHGSSPVPTPWHIRCRNSQAYIRYDLYYSRFQ